MTVKELIKRLKTMSPDAKVCVVRNETYQLSEMTWGIEEVEYDLESVIDLETRVHLEIEE
jgi:hypothetical protein